MAFIGFKVLSWNEAHKHQRAMNLFIVDRLYNAYLKNAESQYEPSYHLNLALDLKIIIALRTFLENGPHGDVEGVKYSLQDRNAIFTTKLKNLQQNDDPSLEIDDPFPYVFNEREMAAGQFLILKSYSPKELSFNDLLVVETNISSYNMSGR